MGIEHAEIGKQIGFRAGRFRTGLIVHLRISAEQGTQIDEDVEDLIFAVAHFIAIRHRFRELAPFCEQTRGALPIDIEAQHELP